MGRTVLVGSTGFVGGNLLASHAFDAACHSTDVAEQFGKDNDLVVYAGVPAAMYLANQDPEADLAVMRAARENLRRLAPKQAVLISSVCVYADSRGKTESDKPEGAALAPYGANRLQLEQWVREDFENALIVRLPALYGKGLKKNFLYDLHTVTPALLRPAKYEELAAVIDPHLSAYDKLLFLNHELFYMIETSVDIDLLAFLYSSQLTTKGKKSLSDSKRFYFKWITEILEDGLADGEFKDTSSAKELMKIYAMFERALLYDWALFRGKYSLSEYSSRLLPHVLDTFVNGI